MPQLRNPLGYLIIGAVIGAILGAVIGIAIGEGAGGSSGGPVLYRTVVSTQTIRVASNAPAVSPPATETTTTRTTSTNTRPTPTTTTTVSVPVPTVTTPVLIQPPTQTTSTTPPAANDVPPADPFTPPADFCTSHVCGAGYLHGKGYVVQCADGVWVKQGGQPTACRDDGGLT